MKKFFLAVAVVFFLAAVPAYAQSDEVLKLEAQYRQLVLQLIQLLTERVAQLQVQLFEVQKENLRLQNEQSKIQGLPYGSPSLPKGIEESDNKSITEEGKVLPVIDLTGQVTRFNRLRPDNLDGKVCPSLSCSIRTVSSDENGNLKIRGGSAAYKEDFNFRIRFLVGNPDKNFIPDFTCEKFGRWSGPVEPYDHWIESIIPGELDPEVQGQWGIRCFTSTETVEKIINVEFFRQYEREQGY